ncbi:hypothetical protein AYI82_00235 [Shewanella algae]|nr:hypothetical protein AYI82_00235 [Shewanella algae]TVL58914.1 hypothetical protein AYJ00_02880 [Shewanella algae]BCV26849.1 hypothetical protein TUM3811_07090 [Shewanella algae]
MLGIVYQMGQIELTQKGGLLFGYLIGLEHSHRPDGLQPVTARLGGKRHTGNKVLLPNYLISSC